MEGDILLLASHKFCESEYRGDIEDQWKETELWGRTFSVPKDVDFRKNDDGSLTWLSHMWNGGAVCTKTSYYFEHKETTNLVADFKIPDPKDFKPCDTFDERLLRNLENTV